MASQALVLMPALIEARGMAESNTDVELNDADLACVVGGLARVWTEPVTDAVDRGSAAEALTDRR